MNQLPVQRASELSCREDQQRKQKAESLDGSYLLKSSRDDLSAEDIRRNYIRVFFFVRRATDCLRGS